MTQNKRSIDNLKIGSLVNFENNCESEIVINIYDEAVVHTYSSNGTVMQYDVSDIHNILAEINIDEQLKTIKNRIVEFNKEEPPKKLITKFKIENLEIGSMVCFDMDNADFEVVIDIYNSSVIYTYSSNGIVMQYNVFDFNTLYGQIYIDDILETLKKKILTLKVTNQQTPKFKFPLTSCQISMNCTGCQELDYCQSDNLHNQNIIHNQDIITHNNQLCPIPKIYYEVFSTYEDIILENNELLPGFHAISVNQFQTIEEVENIISCYACGGCPFIVYKIKGWVRTPICVNCWKGYKETGWLN